MFYTILFFIFIFGVIIGSFLNVVIYRLHSQKPIFKSRSQCPLCKHQLGTHELFPIISYILLGGKCKKCKKPISLQYPLIELITGVLFALAALYFTSNTLTIPDTLTFFKIVSSFIILSFFIVIFVYDLKHFLILNKLSYPLFFFSLIFLLLNSFSGKDPIDSLIFGIGSGLFALAFFLFLYLISKGKWMGGGDVKLSISLGLLLGWPHILVTIFFAFLLGSLIGISLIIFSDKKLKSALPFGAILVLVSTIIFLTGDFFPDLYLRLLGF